MQTNPHAYCRYLLVLWSEWSDSLKLGSSGRKTDWMFEKTGWESGSGADMHFFADIGGRSDPNIGSGHL